MKTQINLRVTLSNTTALRRGSAALAAYRYDIDMSGESALCPFIDVSMSKQW